jgi:hypothetical protein
MPRMSRVELNRAALAQVDLALADGVFDIARAIVRVAESRAPDADTGFYPKKWGGGPRLLGEGLVDRGGAGVWVNGRKTHGTTSAEGRPVKKPRALRVKSMGANIVGVAGFGFPAAFEELGTLHAPAQPFLTPAVAEVVPDAKVILSAAMERRFRGERSEKTAMISARIAAAKAKK